MAGEDPEHVKRVRAMPCAACGATPAGCAHHKMGAGMGRRAHDHMAIPLCHGCHMNLHALRGRFKGWDRERRRAWEDGAVRLVFVGDDWPPA